MLVREPLLPLLFSSFVAAEQACREGEEILEFVTPEKSEKLVVARVWRQVEGELVCQVFKPELLPGFC